MIKIKDGSNVKVYRNLPEQVAKNQRDIEDLANQADTEIEALKERVTTTEEDIAAIKDGTNIDSFKDVEEALDLKADKATTYTKTETDTLLDAKADKATTYTKTETDTLLDAKADKIIELTSSSGTLTDELYNEILSDYAVAIKYNNKIYYKDTESGTDIFFRTNKVANNNSTYYTLYNDKLQINKSSKNYTFGYEQLELYDKSQVDTLLAGVQPELPKRYLHKVHFTCVSTPNGPTFDVYIINNSSDSLNTYRKVFDYIDSTQKVVSMSGALYDSNNIMRILTSFKFDSATTCMYTYYNTSTNSYSSQNIVNISSFVISVQDTVTEIL